MLTISIDNINIIKAGNTGQLNILGLTGATYACPGTPGANCFTMPTMLASGTLQVAVSSPLGVQINGAISILISIHSIIKFHDTARRYWAVFSKYTGW